MISTALDEDLTVIEDLDFDTACDAAPSCDAVAAWFAVKNCCSNTYFFCARHRESFIEQAKCYSNIRCHDCDHLWDNFSGVTIFIWKKL